MIACIGNIAYDFVVFTKKYVAENSKASYAGCDINTGGPASNAACILSRFGNKVDFYGRIGNDDFGKEVFKKLSLEGINLTNVKIFKEVMTPFSFVIVNKETATRTINSVRSSKDLENAYIENIRYESNYDFILTDGKYSENSIELIKRNPQAISIIDAGRWDKGVIKVCENVDYIICSEEFANNVTGLKINNDYKNDVLVFNKLKERFPKAKGITITVGKYGYIYERDNIVLINPPFNCGKPSIDTNCAGDIFHAAFTHALANGYNYYDALEFANVTASISTTRTGGKDSCPTLEEIDYFINKEVSSCGKRKIKKL